MRDAGQCGGIFVAGRRRDRCYAGPSRRAGTFDIISGAAAAPAICAQEIPMSNLKGPNIKKKQKCKNCEGKGTLKKGDKVVTCQRCKGTGVR
jgi:hypothetical protein